MTTTTTTYSELKEEQQKLFDDVKKSETKEKALQERIDSLYEQARAEENQLYNLRKEHRKLKNKKTKFLLKKQILWEDELKKSIRNKTDIELDEFFCVDIPQNTSVIDSFRRLSLEKQKELRLPKRRISSDLKTLDKKYKVLDIIEDDDGIFYFIVQGKQQCVYVIQLPDNYPFNPPELYVKLSPDTMIDFKRYLQCKFRELFSETYSSFADGWGGSLGLLYVVNDAESKSTNAAAEFTFEEEDEEEDEQSVRDDEEKTDEIVDFPNYIRRCLTILYDSPDQERKRYVVENADMNTPIIALLQKDDIPYWGCYLYIYHSEDGSVGTPINNIYDSLTAYNLTDTSTLLLTYNPNLFGKLEAVALQLKQKHTLKF